MRKDTMELGGVTSLIIRELTNSYLLDYDRYRNCCTSFF